MLDIKFVRENPDAVKENIKKKFQDEESDYPAAVEIPSRGVGGCRLHHRRGAGLC